MTDWVITIPKTTSWKDYERELKTVRSGGVLNYRVRFFPHDMAIGDRCFVVHDGAIRGWMEVVGMKTTVASFRCSTTGNEWPAGKYIQRAGEFHFVEPINMRGFRGVRRLDAARRG